MSVQELKPLELIASLRAFQFQFSEEKQEAGDFILESLYPSLTSLQESITHIISNPIKSLIDKYRVIASSLTSIQVVNYCFSLCKLEIGGKYKEHTRQSLEIYILGRKFFLLTSELLQEIFSPDKVIDYLEISRKNSEFQEFNYFRKLIFFQHLIEATEGLFMFQRGTNLLVLNWDLRLEVFFIARNSLNYTDLLDRKITDPYFNEKDEIVRIIIISYEVIITDLKRDYELTRQDFFSKNVILVLEEYKRFCTLLRDNAKVEWLDKQISSWQRITRKGSK